MLVEPAPAKINLALHVRGRRADGRHDLETIFAFCTDGDRLQGEASDALTLDVQGRFADALAGEEDNLVLLAARALGDAAGVETGARLMLTKNLPVASGIGGGSADAAAALRLLTRLWGVDPAHAARVAPGLGSDVPACLLSMTARGEGAGDALELIDAGVSALPILLVNPLVAVSTREVFTRWDGIDRGPLSDWREGRNDLDAPARAVAPVIGDVLEWLENRPGVTLARMSGSGATCFALFDGDATRDAAADACPSDWWHLASYLR
jgi:4-diphosphocytidyl-2-C-methyl-D-erythritol kinase